MLHSNSRNLLSTGSTGTLIYRLYWDEREKVSTTVSPVGGDGQVTLQSASSLPVPVATQAVTRPDNSMQQDEDHEVLATRRSKKKKKKSKQHRRKSRRSSRRSSSMTEDNVRTLIERHLESIQNHRIQTTQGGVKINVTRQFYLRYPRTSWTKSVGVKLFPLTFFYLSVIRCYIRTQLFLSKFLF